MEVMPPAPAPETSVADPVLRVSNLEIEIAQMDRASLAGPGPRSLWLPVVSGVSFDIPRGAVVGLFGESGCGKTTLALALPGLLSAKRYRTRGSVLLEAREILNLDVGHLESVRGARIGVIFQDPLLSLNPVLRVRETIREVMRAHSVGGEGRVEEVLRLAGLDPSPRTLDAYPHRLSGGERQRVAIAAAIACRPALVIADEPFTALDAPRILELARLFGELKERLGIAFLLIDHNPAVIARIADYALVMYAGRIVERGAPEQIVKSPLHPYTAALLASAPQPGDPRKTWPAPIPGSPPGLSARNAGCPFEPRCAFRMPRCAAEMPGEFSAGERHRASCFRHAG
jgi:oligopeptide/dipeptide ABC transporter ATP-binding protein